MEAKAAGDDGYDCPSSGVTMATRDDDRHRGSDGLELLLCAETLVPPRRAAADRTLLGDQRVLVGLHQLEDRYIPGPSASHQLPSMIRDEHREELAKWIFEVIMHGGAVDAPGYRSAVV